MVFLEQYHNASPDVIHNHFHSCWNA